MRPRKTILCVDDNEQALSVRKFMLETRGYRVLTAHTSADALEIFAAGNVDLVLSDLLMIAALWAMELRLEIEPLQNPGLISSISSSEKFTRKLPWVRRPLSRAKTLSMDRRHLR